MDIIEHYLEIIYCSSNEFFILKLWVKDFTKAAYNRYKQIYSQFYQVIKVSFFSNVTSIKINTYRKTSALFKSN